MVAIEGTFIHNLKDQQGLVTKNGTVSPPAGLKPAPCDSGAALCLQRPIDYFDDVAAILNREALWVGKGVKFRDMRLFYLLLTIAWRIF